MANKAKEADKEREARAIQLCIFDERRGQVRSSCLHLSDFAVVLEEGLTMGEVATSFSLHKLTYEHNARHATALYGLADALQSLNCQILYVDSIQRLAASFCCAQTLHPTCPWPSLGAWCLLR
jgi:hypothetical protein